MKMHLRFPILALFVIALFLFQGCGPKIYISPDFPQVKATHHTVALLPFFVTVEAGKLPEGMDAAAVAQMEKDESVTFQQQLYSMFLERQAKGEYTVEFQDVDNTNALLAKANINYDNLSQFTKAEIGSILGVDAMISGNIRRSRPMSTGAAITTAILFGVSGNTNRVDVNVNLHDAVKGSLLWKLDHSESGSLGSSSEGLAKSLMKGISKKFPYKR
jgi:hypothetical protein